MITNFFRIELPFESFQIQRLPFTEEKWRELKEQYNRDVSFFRNGDFMYLSPTKESALELGELVQLTVAENPAVAQSLIRHLLFRSFRDAFPDRIPLSFSPLRFFSTKEEHDAIRRFLPRSLQGVIRFPRLVEVEVRKIIENEAPLFGLLIRSRQRWQFNKPLSVLQEEGFDVIGKSVLEAHVIPGLEDVLAPEEDLLGEINGVCDGIASVLTNDGIVERPLSRLLLQRTQYQIGEYLASRIGDRNATQVFRNLKQNRWERESPGQIFAEIQKIAAWFAGGSNGARVYENADGFCFTVTRTNTFSEASFPVRPTNLIFDFGPGASALSPFVGLANHGPFNSERFADNDFKILALCHPTSRGAMSQFAKQLVDGIPESRYFKRGMKSLFRLNTVSVKIVEVKSFLSEAYEEAIDVAIRNEEVNDFSLALIECPEGSKQIPFRENPYYRARVRLMSYGIPTQGVRDEHLRSTANALQWTLGPMALQIYAKAGGTPWRLPSSQSVDREIVVGIGSSLERANLWSGAEQSKIVGITTFFLGDGSYMLGERLRSVPYAEYFQELLNSLTSSIEVVAEQYAWKEGDTVRIVFHIFKPIKNIEADVVEKLVEMFPRFKILFAFVTVSTQHPWMMFRNVFKERDRTNITLCERGDNLILDPNNCLLQLRGDKDRPNRKHRPPYPVSIRVHEKSTFKDLRYIAQQIHDFSYLSWRSFFPSETPVTVFYSSLIASETRKLGKVPGWQTGFVDKHFRRKLWFL
jgi:hypothetical protein